MRQRTSFVLFIKVDFTQGLCRDIPVLWGKYINSRKGKFQGRMMVMNIIVFKPLIRQATCFCNSCFSYADYIALKRCSYFSTEKTTTVFLPGKLLFLLPVPTTYVFAEIYEIKHEMTYVSAITDCTNSC